MKDITEHSSCRLCGSQSLFSTFDFGETALANSYVENPDAVEFSAPLAGFMCNDCGSFQLSHTVSSEILFSNYLYESSTSPAFVKHFSDYAQSLLESFNLSKDSIVVDIGSNDGILVRPFLEAGINAIGVEPAKNLCDMCMSNDIPTVHGFFNQKIVSQLLQSKGPADIITANNVFAHINDLHEVIVNVKKLLSANGIFVFEVTYLKSNIENCLFDMQYHEHIYTHSVKPLQSLFRQHEMELFNVEEVPTHGGSIRGFARKKEGEWKCSPNVKRLIHLETEGGLYSPSTYEAFNSKIQTNKDKLVEILQQAKQDGKRICCFGAPAKLTTFNQVFGIDGEFIEFVIDDSPLKQDLYTPGTHLPIKSSNSLYTENIDYCLITAWNFASPIMSKHEKFEGKFIVPFPEFKIYNQPNLQ